MNWDDVKNATGDDQSGRFITVTSGDYLQDTTKSLANKRNSYVVVWSREKLGRLKRWNTITQRKLNENGYLALMKKVTRERVRFSVQRTGTNCALPQEIPSDGHDVFVKPTSDDYRSSVWTALKEDADPAQENVFVISTSEPLEGVGARVEQMLLTKYKFKSLR